jgi:hypothetical protein
MVTVAVTFWWRPPAPQSDDRMALARDAVAHTTPPEASRVNSDSTALASIAFPMPAKPYSDQAKPPCRPQQAEVEINGGCWVETTKRPPCENTFEYKGRCYVVVGERAPRPPQSIEQ